ncbi:MAG: translation initiation factor IF-2 [Pseudomonadota bacterium]
MAKVRVYELAKELNMESKALVEKLITGGLDVKNYMSTLDEEAVLRAKDIITSAVSEIIEEKRVKPTVIRRRKKTVIIEEEKALPGPEVEQRAKEAIPEAEQPEPLSTIEPEGVAEPVSPQVEAEVEKELEVVTVESPYIEAPEVKDQEAAVGKPSTVIKLKEKEKVKKAKKRRTDRPAKIIKRPEEIQLKTIVEKEKRPEEKVEKHKPVAPAEAPKSIPEKEKPGLGLKKKKASIDKKEETPRGFVRHRKLEVFERADLYEGRPTKRKEKWLTKKGKDIGQRFKPAESSVPKAIKRKLKIQEDVTVSDLAKAMGTKASNLARKLMSIGVMASLNQFIDFETASVVADEFGYELEMDVFDLERFISETEDKPEDLLPRPPVVTIMGHVDHGKTSLLDYIRQSDITGGESGGITQHIGAYYVQRDGGDIVFLDTPGHEAFTAMRARGAKVTDIIVLVVAADDGVMPQTIEAINHARAANIPIVVAINKIDKPEANPEKVRRELAEQDLIPEEWGGHTIFGNISAKTGEGVDELLELILLQAEVLELKANPNKSSRGAIIEAKLDKTKGSVATVLIKSGTLHQGDYFLCGEFYGRVRAMMNHLGKRLKSAGPSVPVEIYGISGVPMAGDEFIAVNDEKTAKGAIEGRKAGVKTKEQSRRGIVNLDDLFKQIKDGEVKELNLVLKTDVQGSLEALSDSLTKLSMDEIKIRIIHAAPGAITESDVMLASASDAIIIGFNVRANPRVVDLAKRENVDIRYYKVIYNVLQDIRLAMAGLLDPVYKENVIGRADIKEIFHVPKIGTVAGCMVTDGRIERNAKIRLLREEVIIFDGKLSSLRRFKDDVKEVQTGYECGIGLENFQDVKPGDVFEAYQLEEVKVEL